MEKPLINIDDEKLRNAIAKNVREKALKAGNCIIYGEGDNIISEDPRTGEKKILKKSSRKPPVTKVFSHPDKFISEGNNFDFVDRTGKEVKENEKPDQPSDPAQSGE
jgi:hypothetical protein